MSKTIDILIPCYNEEAVLRECYRRTKDMFSKIVGYDFRFILINDGSTDGTLAIMRELHEQDAAVNYLDLSRNFGKELAMMAGIDFSTGDALVVMDADLQDPPELIKEMIKYWQEGYDDVSAKRRSRAGESFFKKWSSHAYYRILQRVSDIDVQRDVGDFRLLDRRCVNALKELREAQRYTKGLFTWVGFRKKEILFDRDARAAGQTKWNYWKLFNLAVEGLTGFTIVPLRAASFIGFLLAIIAIVYMLCIVIKTLMYGDPVPGYPSLVSLILFIGGVQMMFLGIIGEYLGRVFNESKRRPLYLVQEINGKRTDGKGFGEENPTSTP